MTQSQKKQALKKAAQWLANRKPSYHVGCCAAIDDQNFHLSHFKRKTLKETVKFVYSDRVAKYHGYYFGRKFNKAEQNHRVLALLFLVEML